MRVPLQYLQSAWGWTPGPLSLRCNCLILSLRYGSWYASHARWNHCRKRCLKVFSSREGHLTHWVLSRPFLTLVVRFREILWLEQEEVGTIASQPEEVAQVTLTRRDIKGSLPFTSPTPPRRVKPKSRSGFLWMPDRAVGV